MTYRTGRHNHRVIYVQMGAEPSDTDPMVGAMDTPELGQQVVDALNALPAEPEGCSCCLADHGRHCRHCHAKERR